MSVKKERGQGRRGSFLWILLFLLVVCVSGVTGEAAGALTIQSCRIDPSNHGRVEVTATGSPYVSGTDGNYYLVALLPYEKSVSQKSILAGTLPQQSLVKYALYVSMFPQLVAGPIVCYGDIEKQLTARKISGRKLGQGAMLFIIGLSKKAVLANTLGKIFEEISSTSASNLTVLMAWLGCITYAFQIYFDFSGYSDMAIGLGRMFGFEFKKNFDVPYISKSITEFWRRWHISLSSWFREYVYIPLGGNHVTISRNIVNLLIVWMLTGMWHGAAWNFIVWGIYYGVVLVLEKYVWGAIVDRWPSVLQHIYALVLVLVGWVFFFSPSLGAAFRYLFAMVGGGAGFASKEVFFVILTHWLFYLLAVIGSTTIGSRLLRVILNVSENHTVRTVIMLIVFFGMLAISVAYLIADTYNPFLYFRF